MVENKIKQELSLRKDSRMLKRWSKIELPIYLKIYLFEVTNPDEVEYQKGKPILKERGPYTFIESRYKEILGYEQEERLVKYKEFTSFHFDRSNSIGDLEEEITFLNVPVVAAINNVMAQLNTTDLGYVMFDALKAVLHSMGEPLFEVHTIDEMLFKGYFVELLERLKTIAEEFGIEIPENLPNKTFGLLVGKNNSDNGIWEVQTGIGNDAFVVYSWNNSRKVPYWTHDSCNEIKGTDGSSFHPGIQRSETLYAFQPDLCRSAFVTYASDSNIFGVDAFRFTIPKKVFAAPLNDSDNFCLCTRPVKDRRICLINGIQDMSSCRDGAPIVISSPHFFDTDPILLNDVDGLEPVESKHRTYLDVEPVTGAVVNAARRMQINIEIKNDAEFMVMSRVRNMILPLLWIEETAAINEEMANEFKFMRSSLRNANISCWIAIALSFAMTVLGFTLLHTYPYHK
ncbi:Lysosome membrane protein 2-like protein, partial [Dinothrombium tinctorium]